MNRFDERCDEVLNLRCLNPMWTNLCLGVQRILMFCCFISPASNNWIRKEEEVSPALINLLLQKHSCFRTLHCQLRSKALVCPLVEQILKNLPAKIIHRPSFLKISHVNFKCKLSDNYIDWLCSAGPWHCQKASLSWRDPSRKIYFTVR